jgi:uncharacterized membrane-anchored protein
LSAREGASAVVGLTLPTMMKKLISLAVVAALAVFAVKKLQDS